MPVVKTINIPVYHKEFHGDFPIEISVQCIGCLYWNGDIACKAFPGGIPEEILTGEHDHKNQYDGDNGIQFEPIED